MIDRNESLRDKIATIVQAGYSQRKTSVETADEIRSKISFLFILTGLERENDELRADKARLEEALKEAAQRFRNSTVEWEDAARHCEEALS